VSFYGGLLPNTALCSPGNAQSWFGARFGAPRASKNDWIRVETLYKLSTNPPPSPPLESVGRCCAGLPPSGRWRLVRVRLHRPLVAKRCLRASLSRRGSRQAGPPCMLRGVWITSEPPWVQRQISFLDRGYWVSSNDLMYEVLTPAAHANEQGKVSKRVENTWKHLNISATMLKNRQVFLSEKDRYSNSFARGPLALRMTSSLDAREHYGWLHPWLPK
jgi:hypothetical protein